MIQFRCPICDGALTQSPGTVGLTIACAHCHSPIKVPSGAFVAVLDPQRAAVSMLAGDLDP